MRYLLDLINMKKPKWWQFITIMKNRKTISSAKFYIKTIQDIDTTQELQSTVKEFMSVIEHLFSNGYNKNMIIPKHITTFKIISAPSMPDNINTTKSKYFIIEFSINGYTISISNISIMEKASDLNTKLDIYYKDPKYPVPVTLSIYMSNSRLQLYSESARMVFQYIKDFMEIVLLHVIKEIIYLYQ